MNRELIGTALPDSTPTWAQQEVPGTMISRAPELAFFNNKYHEYYALSGFGSQRSVIGLLANATLDPTDPACTSFNNQDPPLLSYRSCSGSDKEISSHLAQPEHRQTIGLEGVHELRFDAADRC